MVTALKSVGMEMIQTLQGMLSALLDVSRGMSPELVRCPGETAEYSQLVTD